MLFLLSYNNTTPSKIVTHYCTSLVHLCIVTPVSITCVIIWTDGGQTRKIQRPSDLALLMDAQFWSMNQTSEVRPFLAGWLTPFSVCLICIVLSRQLKNPHAFSRQWPEVLIRPWLHPWFIAAIWVRFRGAVREERGVREELVACG